MNGYQSSTNYLYKLMRKKIYNLYIMYVNSPQITINTI